MNKINLIGGNYMPSGINNPFKIDCIENISIFWNKYSLEWHGHIEFENGKTSAKQSFANKELLAMLYEMQTFCNNLPKSTNED